MDELTVLPCDTAMANDYFSSAFRCTATLAERFARHRIANAPAPASADLREAVISAWERMPHWDKPLLEELDLTPQGVADLADAALSAISLAQSEQLAERDAEIARLREALEPFAEVVAWAERNGHDLSADFDMLLRGPCDQIAGHLHAQSADFIKARDALKATPNDQ